MHKSGSYSPHCFAYDSCSKTEQEFMDNLLGDDEENTHCVMILKASLKLELSSTVEMMTR